MPIYAHFSLHRMPILFIGSILFIVYTEISVDGTKQDAKAHDGQVAVGPVTEEHRRPSQDDHQLMSGQHAADDVTAEDDAAADDDGEIY